MRKIKILIYIIMLLLLGFSCQKDRHELIVTAHRGASGLAPENTMSAMLKAIEIGSDYAELDVQETKDGVLILLHDSSLRRTARLDSNIWETDYADLNGIDVGAWFDSTFTGEPIPTLEDVIDAVYGKMKLNIELKMNGHEQQLVERVVSLVEKKNFISNCIITSFDFEAINRVKKLNPKIKAGYIFSNMPADVDVFTAPVNLLSVKYTLIDEEFVKKAHANKKKVHVYTVNQPEEMKRLIKLGVDSIITDRPDILLQML